MFKDRSDAGKKLALKLLKYKGKNTVILSIPRGGVIVGYEIAKELNAKLSLIFSRKISAPLQPELAIGAVAEDGTLWLNEKIIKTLNISEEYIKMAMKEEMKKIEKMKKKYYRKDLNLSGKIVIITDDGVATGATIKAAAVFVKKQKPKKIILAFPVIPKDMISDLKVFSDEIIYLEAPLIFHAVGEFYENFEQVEDRKVLEILNKSI